MRITFALPCFTRVPSGGVKMVYEYANRLQARGHEVTILHPHGSEAVTGPWAHLAGAAWRVYVRLRDRDRIPWFSLDSRIELRFPPDLQSERIPDGDVLVATSWHTASWVAAAPAAAGRKYYLVQHFETWSGGEEAAETWRLPLHKVVIARWLADLAHGMGEAHRTTYIPYGLDLERFSVTTPLEERHPARVGMLYHTADWKGSVDGIAAMVALRAEIPDLQCVMFGTFPRPDDLPGWMEFQENPSHAALVELYNSCSIFVQPSWTEGWGLTATEAMSCGCALVTTDNGGSGEYALDGRTALVVAVRDRAALARQVGRLARDGGLRTQLARAGMEYLRRFTFQRAVTELERLFEGGTATSPAPAAAGSGVSALDEGV
jgi:glycosyltransferase involved in cell wall biosynthesis